MTICDGYDGIFDTRVVYKISSLSSLPSLNQKKDKDGIGYDKEKCADFI